MNITQATAEVVATLEGAGLRVQGWEEKHIVPPVAIVTPADPFLDDNGANSFGDPFVVHYDVQLVAGRGTGETVRRAVEDMITSAVVALKDVASMSIDEVRYPLIGGEDDRPTIGAEIAVSAAINLREDK